MAWKDRLRDASFTPYEGDPLPFMYEDFTREFTINGSVYEFPDAKGSYPQALGPSGERYPIRAFFSGDDHDLEADAFAAALRVPGPSVLVHPRYGRRDVVSLGRVVQRDDLKTAANQTVLQFTLYETIPDLYPLRDADAGVELETAVAGASDATAREFADVVDNKTPGTIARIRDAVKDAVGRVKRALDRVTAIKDTIQSAFTLIQDTINSGIDLFIRDPLSLGRQLVDLVKQPGRIVDQVKDRIAAYGNLLDDLLGQGDAPGGTKYPVDVNEYAVTDVLAKSTVIGLVDTLRNGEYGKRPDVIEAIDALVLHWDKYVAWKDAAAPVVGVVDTGEAYRYLQSAVATCQGFLIAVAFERAAERSIVTDGNTTIINLCSRLYGEVDSKLDDMINHNGLSGSEILMLPEGREIVYYV